MTKSLPAKSSKTNSSTIYPNSYQLSAANNVSNYQQYSHPLQTSTAPSDHVSNSNFYHPFQQSNGLEVASSPFIYTGQPDPQFQSPVRLKQGTIGGSQSFLQLKPTLMNYAGPQYTTYHYLDQPVLADNYSSKAISGEREIPWTHASYSPFDQYDGHGYSHSETLIPPFYAEEEKPQTFEQQNHPYYLFRPSKAGSHKQPPYQPSQMGYLHQKSSNVNTSPSPHAHIPPYPTTARSVQEIAWSGHTARQNIGRGKADNKYLMEETYFDHHQPLSLRENNSSQRVYPTPLLRYAQTAFPYEEEEEQEEEQLERASDF